MSGGSDEFIQVVKNPRTQAQDADMVVCHRIEDLPIPNRPAAQSVCADCGARIWIANSSPERPKKVCIPCGLRFAEANRAEGVGVMVSENMARNDGGSMRGTIERILDIAAAPKSDENKR